MKPAPPVTSTRTNLRLLTDFREAIPQALAPVREPRGAGALAAQDGVRGPRRRAAELRRRDRPDAAREAGLLEDRLGELGPAAVALGSHVPHALGQLDELARRGREVR